MPPAHQFQQRRFERAAFGRARYAERIHDVSIQAEWLGLSGSRSNDFYHFVQRHDKNSDGVQLWLNFRAVEAARGRREKRSRGFTIIEVLVASFILIVGLVAVAGVVGSTLGSTARSEYMTQAATLATEKLEDLNRYPSTDPNVAVTNGTSAGSLTSDILQDVTVNGVTEAVNLLR